MQVFANEVLRKTWHMFNWNHIKDHHGWRYCNSYTKSYRHLDTILLMQGPAYPISTEFTALLSKPQQHSLIRDICRKYKHLTVCGIQLVLNTEPHTDGHYYGAGCCHQWVYPDACSWPLYVASERSDSNSLHWFCCEVKSKSRCHMMSKNSNFTGECLWLNFFSWDEVRSLHCTTVGFPMGTKWYHQVSLPTRIC